MCQLSLIDNLGSVKSLSFMGQNKSYVANIIEG